MKQTKLNSCIATFVYFLCISVYSPAIQAATSEPQSSSVSIWDQTLRNHFFSDEPILEQSGVLSLEAPKRAEDPSLVPLRIRAAYPQTAEQFIEEISIIIDRNPDPLAGVFKFGPKSGRADLELRIRVDQYSHVRVIAKDNKGQLHMASKYVKASGGCSAPSSGDLDAAMARMGKMRLQTRAADLDGPALVSAQLRISHPNITGMQKNQVTHLYYPAHFVRKIRVSLDDEPIFSAEVGISISENPSFRFYLKREDINNLGSKGELVAEVFDSKENRFVKADTLMPDA